jgi:peroxiredoxin
MPFAPAQDDGGAHHLRRGMELPRLALPTTVGQDVCLAEHRGQCALIVYPWTGRPGLPNPPQWDDIPGAHGSTPELEGFRDLTADFERLGVGLFGLSRQTTDHQREMVARLVVPFPILSDAEGRFAVALALPSFSTGGTIYLKRLTLILNGGKIQRVIYPVVEPATHASDVLRLLRVDEPS